MDPGGPDVILRDLRASSRRAVHLGAFRAKAKAKAKATSLGMDCMYSMLCVYIKAISERK